MIYGIAAVFENYHFTQNNDYWNSSAKYYSNDCDFVLEYNNVKTLGNLSLNEKLWASFFQGITPRTAGFNTVDYGGMEESSILFTMILMFIGAGSVSTGGGIKLTTFVILITSVLSFFRKRRKLFYFSVQLKCQQ